MTSLSNLSFLISHFKKGINWKQITRGIYKKALKYVRESTIYKIEEEKDDRNGFKAYSFYWKPIKGYNKSVRIVRIVIFENGNIRIFCNCDGYKRNKICSHILATYIKLKSSKNSKK